MSYDNVNQPNGQQIHRNCIRMRAISYSNRNSNRNSNNKDKDNSNNNNNANQPQTAHANIRLCTRDFDSYKWDTANTRDIDMNSFNPLFLFVARPRHIQTVLRSPHTHTHTDLSHDVRMNSTHQSPKRAKNLELTRSVGRMSLICKRLIAFTLPETHTMKRTTGVQLYIHSNRTRTPYRNVYIPLTYIQEYLDCTTPYWIIECSFWLSTVSFIVKYVLGLSSCTKHNLKQEKKSICHCWPDDNSL